MNFSRRAVFPVAPIAFAVLCTLQGHAYAALPNGIAAGDVTQSSAVLWGRTDTLGAMTFEIATDPAFTGIFASTIVSVANPFVPAKWDLGGLAPGSTYFYRARDAAGAIENGTFKTASAPGARNGLRFGVSGDWRGELAPYPAVKNVPTAGLSFFVKNGDTIYAERYSGPAQPTAATLPEYRDRHNEVLSQRNGLNTWKDVRSSTAIFATIDDHEVVNDFSGGQPVGGAFYNDTQRYKDGLQAFREYMPIRENNYTGTGSARFDGKPNLYRSQSFGSDAALFITDARSFRDPGLTPWNGTPADAARFLSESATLNRTMLGRQQLDTLKTDLKTAEQNGTTWKFVVLAEPTQNLGLAAASDRYEGYARERTELLSFIKAEGIDNVVFVTADIHGTLVNDLTYSTGGPQIQSGAWEISTGAVAFDAPFGPTVIDLAGALGLLTAPEIAFYNSLPNAFEKDQFIKNLVNANISPLGYSPIGLEGSGISFTNLLATDYSVATHIYGWTQFDIDRVTGKLKVTTYGLSPYTYDDIAADALGIAGLTPQIVSQFEVTPVPEPETYALMLAGLGFVGWAARRGKTNSTEPNGSHLRETSRSIGEVRCGTS